MRPLILLSNDDGYFAPGLRVMQAALAEKADVVVCAPELNQSASSHSLSLHRVLRLRHIEPHVFAVDGTPADCVYVALHSGGRILPRRPDLVVSGINHGLNLGVDVFYSGTVAAAREGALRGISSIAVSADTNANFEYAAEVAAKLAYAMLERDGARAPLEEGVVDATRAAPLLNVNIPPGSAWPVRATRLGARVYEQDVVYREDPRGREYLWIGGSDVRHDPVPGSDTEAFDEGCVSVTPLTLDLFAPADSSFASDVAAAIS